MYVREHFFYHFLEIGGSPELFPNSVSGFGGYNLGIFRLRFNFYRRRVNRYTPQLLLQLLLHGTERKAWLDVCTLIVHPLSLVSRMYSKPQLIRHGTLLFVHVAVYVSINDLTDYGTVFFIDVAAVCVCVFLTCIPLGYENPNTKTKET